MKPSLHCFDYRFVTGENEFSIGGCEHDDFLLNSIISPLFGLIFSLAISLFSIAGTVALPSPVTKTVNMNADPPPILKKDVF